MSTGLFIQVRLGSARLPSKAILPLAGATIIEHVMRALRPVPAEVRVLLTDVLSAEALREKAAPEGYEVLAGPAEDVLARYCLGARTFRVETIVRATGDNPLTSARLARSICEEHEAAGADLSHYLGCPLGTGVEVIQATALFEAEREASGPEEREHITTWLYRHRDRYRVLEPQAPPDALLPGRTVSVDTAEDYEEMQRIFAALYRGAPIEADELVRYLSPRGALGDSGNPRHA